MSKQCRPVLTLTILTSAIQVADRFITIAGAVPSADGGGLGVVKQAAASGEYVSVDVLGTTMCEAGAAITKGDTLKLTSTGKVITWASSGVKVGIALQAAAADTNIIEILLTPVAA